VAHDETKVYALNLFDVADREEYLAYSRWSAREVAKHGGRVVALGRFHPAASWGALPSPSKRGFNGSVWAGTSPLIPPDSPTARR